MEKREIIEINSSDDSEEEVEWLGCQMPRKKKKIDKNKYPLINNSFILYNNPETIQAFQNKNEDIIIKSNEEKVEESHASENKIISEEEAKQQPNITKENSPNVISNEQKLLSSENPTPQSPLKIISWNINGLRRIATTGQIQSFFNAAAPDILCLNEIKMSESKVHEYGSIKWVPSNYFYYLNCCQGKGCYGVGVITRIKPVSVRYGMGIEKHDLEARIITVEYEKFYIVCCYVPYSGDRLERFFYRINEWDPDFRKYINGLKEIKTTIVCGDMNVAHEDLDVFNPKLPVGLKSVTKEERENFTKLIMDGFVDIFRYKYPKKQKYTFFSKLFDGKKQKKGWRLDYFLVDKASKWNVVDTDVLDDIEGSDHCPIQLIYKHV